MFLSFLDAFETTGYHFIQEDHSLCPRSFQILWQNMRSNTLMSFFPFPIRYSPTLDPETLDQKVCLSLFDDDDKGAPSEERVPSSDISL